MSQVLLDFTAFDMTRDVALFGSGLKPGMVERIRRQVTILWRQSLVVFRTFPLASETASRYGAATFRSLSMSSSLSLARMVMVAGLVTLSLSACGRRGALEAPPSASAPAAQPESTVSDTALPSPVGTPRSSPRQGYTIPNKSFILDPLL
ncbi:putative small lipoprotein YifL [Microvirga lupini]|uniref:Putative small lipoprotein YifL n=1 Tax=Microvirga lupini TaxID=420324 RepID=A0A7W4VPB0_9HYPH|nr:lipoprotein [Microvirga lupini]MBB3020460.1 putative small lipoprotein YifL [Microvirga lupini]